jgi:hypothetical protein
MGAPKGGDMLDRLHGDPAPTTPLDLGDLARRAADLAAPILAARNQTIAIGPEDGLAIVQRQVRLGPLLSCAIQEISGYTIRDGSISCLVLHHAIILRGENPIVMPEHALALDWLTNVRARALGVSPVLGWDQGRGPTLTLLLPAPRQERGSNRGAGWTWTAPSAG